jgi:hypothetical protein
MSCSKATYPTYAAASAALRSIRDRARRRRRDQHHGLPVRAYRCPACSSWHLTSTPTRFDAHPTRRAA